jgi:hypothetical protein
MRSPIARDDQRACRRRTLAWLRSIWKKAAQLDEGNMSVIGEDPKFLSRLGGV